MMLKDGPAVKVGPIDHEICMYPNFVDIVEMSVPNLAIRIFIVQQDYLVRERVGYQFRYSCTIFGYLM